MLRFVLALPLALGIALSSPALAQGEAPPEAPQSESIPFSSFDEALKALHSNPNVVFRNEGGWIVAEDKKAMVVWLLTPAGHPAYPSIVKRSIVNGAEGAYMQTDTRCFATQTICDKYFGEKP